jgi:hypothetical protein
MPKPVPLPTFAKTLQAGIELSKPGTVPNDARDQALSQISQGLRNDVPFGIGRLMEAYAQAAINSTGEDIKLNGRNASLSQEVISALHEDVNAGFGNVGESFGGQSIAGGLNGLWNYNDSFTYFTPVNDLIFNAALAGGLLSSSMAIRLHSSIHFLWNYVYAQGSEGFPDTPNLNLAYPGAKLSRSEPDVDMLNRVLPAYTWSVGLAGVPLPGAAIDGISDSINRVAYYAPLPPSLDEIFHLWDYTPSSGGDSRNAITDFIGIISLLPLSW